MSFSDACLVEMMVVQFNGHFIFLCLIMLVVCLYIYIHTYIRISPLSLYLLMKKTMHASLFNRCALTIGYDMLCIPKTE